MNVREMLDRGVRLSDLSTDELLELQKEEVLGMALRDAVENEIVRRLTYGTGNASSANPELPLPQR